MTPKHLRPPAELLIRLCRATLANPPSPQGKATVFVSFYGSHSKVGILYCNNNEDVLSVAERTDNRHLHLIRRLRRHLPLKGKANTAPHGAEIVRDEAHRRLRMLRILHLIRRVPRHLPLEGKANTAPARSRNCPRRGASRSRRRWRT